ncbi:MAG: hypothetical protein ACI9M1_002280, partial [Porticoccaceae bacterium]
VQYLTLLPHKSFRVVLVNRSFIFRAASAKKLFTSYHKKYFPWHY